MTDVIASSINRKIDHIMDIFFGAGVASHPTIIEQINYLLFMRALSQKDDDLRKIGVTDSDKIVFDGDLEKYHWDNLLALNAEQLFIVLEECFRKIPESTTNRTVRLVFRNAHIKLFDKPSLRTVLHEIDAFAKLMDDEEHDGKRDIFGDTYEYLLSKLSQAGTSGQFRTPRHIIEFLVEIIAPKKGETILDPAAGTAGFLVKTFEYLRREYTSSIQFASGGAFDKLNSKEHSFLYEHTFNGFDSDEDMIKFGMMNLYLHGLQNARMIRQNTLTDTAGSRDKYDVILANPPFKGKIDRDSVAEEIQMNTSATEVLFLRYMLRHLTDNGRAGVIVPEGVLFNTSSAYIRIRNMLIENGLWCVVSLPGGVFNPYAGVKTSILFFDKTRKNIQEVLFAKVEHDGFGLGAQRRPIAKNDLPEILQTINKYKNNSPISSEMVNIVSYDQIKATKDVFLSGDRYLTNAEPLESKYVFTEMGDIAEFVRGPFGSSVKRSECVPLGNNTYKIYEQGNVIQNDFNRGVYYLPEDKFKKLERFAVAPGDILITCAGTLGRIAIVPNGVEKGIINSVLMRVRVDSSKALKEYMVAILKSDLMQNKISNNATGVAVKNMFATSELKRFKIPLPPLNIQSKIIADINNKQNEIDKARGVIAGLESEKNAILINAIAPK